MEYQALYRQFRPDVFGDMVGQEHIVTALTNQINAGRLAHAYLFCGTRGTGKTTTARILSRAVNCENRNSAEPCNECPSCKSIIDGSAIDVVEIDAASNTSVDNIREIREEVVYPPVMLKFKVYIIDEVHMLSTGAFNALLKTLEEPPEHVIFILATTEYHKVPATILSRCQRFDFKRISAQEIQERLRYVCESSGASIDNEACSVISYAADGSMRDGLAILDKCISYGNNCVTGELASKILGIVDDGALFEMSECIARGDVSSLIEHAEKAVRDGRDPTLLTVYLIEHFRCLLIAKLVKNTEDVLQISTERANNFRKQAEAFTTQRITSVITKLSDIYKTQKEAPNPKVMLEIGLVSVCGGETEPVKPVCYAQPTVQPQVNPPEMFVPPMPTDSDIPAAVNEDLEENTKSVVSMGNSVQSCWTEILDEIRRNGKMMLFSGIMLASPYETDGFLDIVFKNDQKANKDMVSTSENAASVEQAIKAVCGKDLKVRFKIESENSASGNNDLNGILGLADKFPGIVSIDESEE